MDRRDLQNLEAILYIGPRGYSVQAIEVRIIYRVLATGIIELRETRVSH